MKLGETKSDLNAEYIEIVSQCNDKKETCNLEARLLQCKKDTLGLVQDAMKEWCELEKNSLEKRCVALDKEALSYEEKIAQLKADSGFFSKKKAQNAIPEVENLLKDCKARNEGLKAILSQEQFTAEKADLNTLLRKEGAAGDDSYEALEEKRKAAYEKLLKEAEKEEKLRAEYEVIVKNFQ
jgi:hypothetical protein